MSKIIFSRSQGRYVREADYTDAKETAKEPVVLTADQIALVTRYVKLRTLRTFGDASRRGAPGKIQEQLRAELSKISKTVRALPLDVQEAMEKQKATIKV